MLVHLVPDEKFIDVAIRQFESVAPGTHIWVVLGKPRTLTHIRSDRIRFLHRREVVDLLQGDSCAGVVLHSMNDRFLPLLERIPPHKNVVWIGWGYDYHSLLIRNAPIGSLLLPETLKVLRGRPARLRLKDRVMQFANLLLGHHSLDPQKALRRVDYFSPVLDVEYKLAKQENPLFPADYISWNYGTLEEDYQPSGDLVLDGRNILLGNSATPENNHIDTLIRLSDSYEVGDRDIITPLSYGDPWYADQVEAFGEKVFGAQFRPLRTYIDRDAYYGILSTCGFAFMNHKRQQAFGNIAFLLLAETAVHMNPVSPLRGWLADRGVQVFDIPDPKVPSRIPLRALDPDERAGNLAAMRAHWGPASQDRKTLNLVETATRARIGYAGPSVNSPS